MKQNSQTKKWLRITDAKNIPLREGRAVQIAGQDIAIFNLGDRFLAVENKCPHRGGPLADGIVSGRTVVCPLHAWKVDLESGQVTNRPEENPCVRMFATTVRDGVVMLEVSIPEEHYIALQPPSRAQNAPQLPVMSAGD
jgi:nitrite reductase [NAD(P)H] small subunit